MTSQNVELESAAGSPAGPPAFADDLPCPLCDYNLRGLTTPRCPECGFAFRWDDLLDERHGHHRYLFEHARQHRSRRFLDTYLRTTLPRRFWREVTPANPVDVRRLLIYWVVATAPLLLPAVAAVTVDVVQTARENAAERAQYHPVLNRPDLVEDPAGDRVSAHYLDVADPKPWTRPFVGEVLTATHPADFPPIATVAAAAFLWPWLTVASMLIFRRSMRQARVNPGHVLRAAIYSCDCGLLLLLTTTLLLGPKAIFGQLVHLPFKSLGGAEWPQAGGVFEHDRPDDLFAATGVLGRLNISAVEVLAFAAVAVVTYRITFACSRYLRFNHSFLTAAASQVIVCLVVGIVALRIHWSFW